MKKLLVMSLGILILSMNSFAEQEKPLNLSEESRQLLTELGKDIDNTLITISKIELKAGGNIKDINFNISRDAGEFFSLGIVLDSNDVENGLKILSVSPNSNAEDSGVKPGDIIVKVNDLSVSGNSLSTMLNHMKNQKEYIELQIKRKDEVIEKKIPVEKMFLPSYKLIVGKIGKEALSQLADKNSCGFITIDHTPPVTKYLYPVSIRKVNDNSKVSGILKVKLSVGKHIVYVTENIVSNKVGHRGNSRHNSKAFELDVKANTTYQLAAKYNPRNKFKTVGDEYWQPVVWRTIEQSCEM